MDPDDDAPEVIIVNNEGGDPPEPEPEPEPELPPPVAAEVAAAIDLAAAQAIALAAERVEGFMSEVRSWQETHEASGHVDLRARLEATETFLSSIQTQLTEMETMMSSRILDPSASTE